MKYAVVRIKGHQYKVSEGEEILVDKVGDPKLEIETLLVVDGKKVQIGKPTLEKAKVTFKILDIEVKGTKIAVIKYKAKSRYRRHTGFRPVYTKLLVEKISE